MVYRVCTNKIVIDGLILERGSLVDEPKLAGLSAYFMRLGIIEYQNDPASESAYQPKALSGLLKRFMTPVGNA